MMDNKEVFEQIASKYNLESELDKRKAYSECIHYTNENLDFRYANQFLAYAAERLGQVKVNCSAEEDAVEIIGDERIYLEYDQEYGPVLSGNQSGLTYLWKLIRNLSITELVENHIHLYYGERPLFENSFPLTIYLEDDEWFNKNTNSEHKKEEEIESPVKKTNINIKEIAAILINEEIPPQLLMTKGKIYKVISSEKYVDQDIMTKRIGDKLENMYAFKIKRDDKKIQQIGLDLDDGSILFLTKKQLEQLL